MKKFLVSLITFLMLGGGTAFAIPTNPDGGKSETACEKSSSPVVDDYDCYED